MDQDANCAPLRHARLPEAARYMRLRIVVREVEARFMVDAASLARYVALAKKKSATAPEAVLDRKAEMVNLAR